MPLYQHTSNRAELLADALAGALLASPPDDPFQPVSVCVGSRGMERWLRNRLSLAAGGLAMNLAFPFPKDALRELFPAGPDATEVDQRWAPASLAWAILHVLPGALESCATELAPIAAWLDSPRRVGGPTPAPWVTRDRWALAQELAAVIDKASLFRPHWTAAWERGQRPDGPSDWQGVLWRALRAAIPGDPLPLRLRSSPPAAGSTLHVFAVSSMPPLFVEALVNASRRRDVHVYSLVPTAEHTGADATAATLRARARRGEDVTAQLAGQSPLLTAFGRVAFDAQVTALEHDLDPADGVFVPPACGDAGTGCCALHTLQGDVLARLSRDEIDALRPSRPLREDDDSVQFHDTHGPTRQVEACREALLDLFARHPDLEPRDVLVMTPDLATYAPLVSAVFGQGYVTHHLADGWGDIGAPRIPVSIADLGIRALNPLADTLLRVVGLVQGRLTATALADLAGLDPVRRRFAFTDDDLVRVRGWLLDAGARWGADEAERVQHQNPSQREGTLAFALDRLALGVAMADDGGDDPFGVAPYDELEGDGVVTFGKLAELCGRLAHWRGALAAQPARPLSAWLDLVRAATEALGEPAAAASFLRAELEEQLDSLKKEAQPLDPVVRLDALEAMLTGRFDRPRSGDRPTTGAVTVCAMQPMRSVPFRVITLLGMDDGAFPRRPAGRGFDATLKTRMAGDQDPREEDRNLLLETLLSARSHLLVFYTGRDRQTNERRAPAVPIGELLDACDLTFLTPFPEDDGAHVTGGERRQARHALVRTHAVQPFSASGFRAGTGWPGDRPPPRFDLRARRAALALGATRTPWSGIGHPKPTGSPPKELTLSDLVQWLRKPIPQYLRKRLGLYPARGEQEVQDRETIDLDALASWALDDQLASAWVRGELKAGDDSQRLQARFLARGWLPPGEPGAAAFANARANVLAAAAPLEGWSLSRVHVSARIGDVEVSGDVPVATRGGERVLFALGPGEADKPEKLIRAWVGSLAWAVARPGESVETRTLGQHDGAGKALTLRAPKEPTKTLDALVATWRRAWSEPIRLAERTSSAYARAFDAGKDALAAAHEAWAGGYERPGESKDAEIHVIFPAPVFEPEDDGSAVHPDFHSLATGLWLPILEASR